VRFIDRNFTFYIHWYSGLRHAADQLTRVYYNSEHDFTPQYPVLLAPIRVTDGDEMVYRKLRITGAFLDILIHRRIQNWRDIRSGFRVNFFYREGFLCLYDELFTLGKMSSRSWGLS
jgi:hypothetical protein